MTLLSKTNKTLDKVHALSINHIYIYTPSVKKQCKYCFLKSQRFLILARYIYKSIDVYDV
jgi:hypothetical protein